MNIYRHLVIVICAMAFFFLTVMLLVTNQFVSTTNAKEIETVTDTEPITNTLVVAIKEEPDSLYIYGTNMLASEHLFNAIMDGPITSLNYDYQPVIIESIPSLDGNDAVIQDITVNTGDTVVNANGEVTTLANGDTIIDSNGDSVTFQGAPLLMNQMVVTFTLKSDIFWSDGTQVTASDSIFSQQVGCHSDTPVSKFTCDRTASYTNPDSLTNVWESVPGFIDSTYYINYWTPLPQHLLGSMSALEILGSDYGSQPLGWGPYQIDEWIMGESISLSRNLQYWRPDFPKIDNIVFKFYSDLLEAQEALIAGEVHLIDQTLTETSLLSTYALLDNEDAINVYPSPGTVFEHIDFAVLPYDNRPVFFDDVEVRRAVTLCTDRQSIVDEVYAGYGEIAHAYIAASHPLYDTSFITEWDFNPALGQSKLDTAGWQVGVDGWRYKNGRKFVVELITTTGNELRSTVTEMFKDDMVSCGIDVELLYLPAFEVFGDGPDAPIFGRKFDLTEFAWSTSVSPPCDLWTTANIPGPVSEGFNGWGGGNNSGYSNVAFDTACNTANGNLWRTSAYEDNHKQALQTWTNELPIMPMFFRIKVTIANSNLQGIELNETERSVFWNVGDWVFASEATATAADGGTFLSKDGRVSLSVDGGAFDEAVTLTHTPVATDKPTGLYRSGQIFELTAVNQSNGQPATLMSGHTFEITVTFSEEQLNQLWTGIPGLGLYYWDGNGWILEPTSTVNVANQTVTATPDHLSVWGLFSDSPPALYLPLILKD